MMNQIETKGLFSSEDIELAWERVCASVGSDVKDYFGINVFDSNISLHLRTTFDELESNSYSPTRPFKYFEPKKCGTQRTKTVLGIKDAIVYQAIADKIGTELYQKLAKNKDFVFGSVLNENVSKGIDILDEDEPDFYFFEYYVNLYNRFVEGISETLTSGEVQYKLETDITGFFDCIPHATLLLKLHAYGIEKGLLDLLSSCLNSWSGTRDNVTLNVGIPQGPPASFLLANILLDELDEIIIDLDLKYFRFMDDIRVYAPTREKLLDILVIIDRNLKAHSLSINASKTEIKIVDAGSNEEDLMLDGSGISFDEELFNQSDFYGQDSEYEFDVYGQNEEYQGHFYGQNTEAEDERKAEIDQIEIEQRAENELVVQDETQLKNINKHVLNSSKISLFLLKDTESKLLGLFESNKDIDVSEALPNDTVRTFLTLSQRWRSLCSSLKDSGEYIPDLNLVKVWFFGVEKIYWKSNSMAWNLNLYDCLEGHAEEYERILVKLSRFEWVKYQLLNVFYKVYPSDFKRHEIAIEELTNEQSPLIRLGYFSVLVVSIKEDSSLFNSYSDALKKESDEYVKEAILSSVHYKNTQVSIQSLKEWFLK
jgi:hypothetical protein